jgi:hypothetical protein
MDDRTMNDNYLDDQKLWMICPRQPSSEPYLPGTVFVLGLPHPWALIIPHGLFAGAVCSWEQSLRNGSLHNPSIGLCSKLYGFPRWVDGLGGMVCF